MFRTRKLELKWGAVDDILGQLRGDFIRLALLGIAGGVSPAATVIGWLIRRDIRRSHAEVVEHSRVLAKEYAAQGLEVATLTERLDDHVRRSGLEIKDIQYRVGIMATQVRRDITEVDIPEWPSR